MRLLSCWKKAFSGCSDSRNCTESAEAFMNDDRRRCGFDFWRHNRITILMIELIDYLDDLKKIVIKRTRLWFDPIFWWWSLLNEDELKFHKRWWSHDSYLVSYAYSIACTKSFIMFIVKLKMKNSLRSADSWEASLVLSPKGDPTAEPVPWWLCLIK